MSRGFSLLECAVATGIIALCGAALMFPLTHGTHATAAATSPERSALDAYAASVLRDVAQTWKYGDPGTPSVTSYDTTVSVRPSASPLPVNVSASVSRAGTQSAMVTVRVTSASSAATTSGIVYVKAPIPGSRINAPNAIPAPP